MIIFLILLLILFIYKIKPIKPFSGFNDLYLEKNVSMALKGYFALLIVCHHLAQRIGSGSLFCQIFQYSGYLFTGVFFFLSGYGLHKSYITIPNYKKSFLSRRFSSVLIPYIVVVGIFWILKSNSTVYDAFGEMFRETIFVPFSWFIMNILYLYIIFYFLMNISNGRKFPMIVGEVMGTLLWICLCAVLPCGEWWYNTTFLFVFGMIWALYEKNILFCLKKYLVLIFPMLIMMYIISDLKTIQTMIFVVLLLIFSLKFKIGNGALNFLGSISLDVYLLQGICMGLTRKYIENDFYWCGIVIILDILAAYVLHTIISRLRLMKQKS